MKRTLLVIALSLALSGCGEPKIDGKSESSYQASILKIADGLREPKKKEFAESLAIVAMSDFSLADVFSGKQTAESMKVKAITSLDGKTADQVISEASKIKAERESKEKQQAAVEIQELLKQKESAEKDRSELAKFTVTKSRFVMQPERYSSYPQPIVDLTVENGTSHPVSRAFFRGTISTPGRAVPWFSGDFNYSISGGLEPGEHATWSLALNKFTEWGKAESPAGAVFTVEVVRLDGPDQKPLFDSSKFNETSEKRLSALQGKL
jgi:hypothetical protein